ncbi:MAG: acyl-CoA dehydrogenase [Pseudomonadota bacterium]
METLLVAFGITLLLGFLYVGKGYWAWVSFGAALLLAWFAASPEPATPFGIVAGLFFAVAFLFGRSALRRPVVSLPVMRFMGKVLPKVGDTERIALEAGTVWWDGEIFSGNPDWQKLIRFQSQPLTERERAFLDGPVEELCAMLDDWEIAQGRDVPPKVWDFLKQHRFLGMIIPEAYGGLGFSAIAHSAVVTKISSRSGAAAVVVMVPNSLGPGELLLHYGTEEQKNHYLPRLARGEEIPCFALTEPTAGSDAASMTSSGTVCRGTYEGKEVLGIRLNWRKRYITLAPIATVVGLAFRCYDPDGLLGNEKDLGITCALIPRSLPGIEIGARHDPMGVPFPNGPVFGRDAFIPLDFVIGGRDGIGHGWRMLMESLAAGRSVSLPSLSIGAAQMATRVAGAYGTVREQFNLPIGRLEGIEEPLARIAGFTYLMDAARKLTCGAVDAGEKPAVLSAIVKAYLTNGMRGVLNDAMDIRAGAEICRGPKNILGRAFTAVPIAITVEGANILTRSLIVYGQGAVRAHPFVREEMEAVAGLDLARFDRAFFGHVNFAFRNLARAFLLGVTGARFMAAPVSGPSADYYRTLTRLSAAFALISDAALAIFGGDLKRREKVGGRLADALAWQYLAAATLKRFEDEGQPTRDTAVMRWSAELALAKIETALCEVLDNLPSKPIAVFLRLATFPWGRTLRPPRDTLGGEVAAAILDDGELRRHLTSDIYIPSSQEEGLGALEAALVKIVAAQPARAKLKRAFREGRLQGDSAVDREAAVTAGILTETERRELDKADAAREAVIQVDVFAPGDYASLKG